MLDYLGVFFVLVEVMLVGLNEQFPVDVRPGVLEETLDSLVF